MVTIKDVAKEAGVSITTVSFILNNKDNRHKKATKDKVLKAARKLKYVPNLRAKNFSNQKSNLIGLMIPDIRNPFYTELAKEIGDMLIQENYGMLLLNSDADLEQELKYLKLVDGKLIDGMIVLSRNTAAMDQLGILENSPRVIFVDDIDRSLSTKTTIVSSNNYKGGYIAGEYLYSMGHRKVAYIGGNPESNVTLERLKGFSEYYGKKGLPVKDELVLFGDYGIESIESLVRELLHHDFTGVFCVNDLTAYKVIYELRKLGLNVPEDISVIGYDNLMISQYIDIRLTTIDQYPTKVGELSAIKILEILEGNKENKGMNYIEPRLVIGETVAPIK